MRMKALAARVLLDCHSVLRRERRLCGATERVVCVVAPPCWQDTVKRAFDSQQAVSLFGGTRGGRRDSSAV